MIDIYRAYTQLRHTLQPYIVSAAAQAATGMPIVRPMAFESRRDRKLVNLWDQYLFGPDLLVAPVWKVGQRSRTVYLPRGRWRNYFDQTQAYDGGRTLAVTVPLETADLPSCDLFYSGYALSFLRPDAFRCLWATARDRLRPWGFLVVNIFGDRHAWAGTEPDSTFLPRADVEHLLDGLEIVAFDEVEEDGGSFTGPTHWHLFDIVARRPA